MCPERHILSLYVDKELPSPWKETMDAHLASCQECRNRLEQYQKLSTVFEQDRQTPTPELERRVWNKVITPRPAFNNQVWKRSISLPIPLAAAAAAVFMFVLFLAVQGRQFPNANNVPVQATGSYEIAASTNTDTEETFPFSDLNSVLQYLSEQSSEYVYMQLPDTRNFSSYGEPTLLKATDYSRSQSPR